MEQRKKNILCLAGIALVLAMILCAIFALVGEKRWSAEAIEAQKQDAVTFSANDRNIEVTGAVYTADGHALPNVTITSGSVTAHSAPDGSFRIQSADGYVTFEKEGFYKTISFCGKRAEAHALRVEMMPLSAYSPITGRADASAEAVWLEKQAYLSLLRQEEGLALSYRVVDYNICFGMEQNTDMVAGAYAESDSVEVFIDTAASFSAIPTQQIYGIGIYPNGMFHVLQGRAGQWVTCESIMSFSVTMMGTADDDVTDKGYRVEIFIPYEAIGSDGTKEFSFTACTRGVGTHAPNRWYGMASQNGKYSADPNLPVTYQLFTTEGKIKIVEAKNRLEIDAAYLDDLAVVDAEKVLLFEAGNFLYEDWWPKVSRHAPEQLVGLNYVFGSVQQGSRGAVTRSGWLIALVPSILSTQQKQSLLAEGWQPIAQSVWRVADGQMENEAGPNDVYVAYFEAGEEVRIDFRSVILFGQSEEVVYYQHEWNKVPARIFFPEEYTAPEARWYGVGSSQMLSNGTMVSMYMSGGTHEPDPLNYIIVDISKDEGKTWQRAFYIDYPTEEYRAWSPRAWQDPAGNLWLSWSQSDLYFDRGGVWMCKVTNLDADVRDWQFSVPKRVYDGENMTKPIVIDDENGDELYLDAVYSFKDLSKTYIYASSDQGETWQLRGTVDVGEDAKMCHEGTLVEVAPGVIWLEYRATAYPAGESYSYDHGKTWTKGRPSYLKAGYSLSTFHKTESGKILFVSNDEARRDKLSVYILENNGKTFAVRAKLCLDPRPVGESSKVGAAYPSVSERDGKIYIVWDHDRNVVGCVTMAIITEQRIYEGGTLREDELIVVNQISQ